MTEDKSSWAIGGGVVGGLGLGLLFHHYIPLAIPAFTLLDLGIGLIATSLISKKATERSGVQ